MNYGSDNTEKHNFKSEAHRTITLIVANYYPCLQTMKFTLYDQYIYTESWQCYCLG